MATPSTTRQHWLAHARRATTQAAAAAALGRYAGVPLEDAVRITRHSALLLRHGAQQLRVRTGRGLD